MATSSTIPGNTPAPESINEHSGRNTVFYSAPDCSFNGLWSAIEVIWQDDGCRLIEHIILEIGIIRDVSPINSTQFTRYAMELSAQFSNIHLIFYAPDKGLVMGLPMFSGN